MQDNHTPVYIYGTYRFSVLNLLLFFSCLFFTTCQKTNADKDILLHETYDYANKMHNEGHTREAMRTMDSV